MSLLDATPDIHIRKGTNYSVSQIYAEGGWTVKVDGNNVVIRGLGTNGDTTATFDSEAETNYHLIIPEGLLTNDLGERSEWLDITYIGSDKVNAIRDISAETENQDTPAYNIAGQRVTQDTKGIVIQNGKKRLNR